MNTRLIVRSILALVLIAGLWLVWWVFGRSHEAQVRVAQAALIEAVEERDWDEVAEFLAANYTDAYSHTRESAIQDGKKYLSGFYTLTLKTDQTKIQVTKEGMVTSLFRLGFYTRPQKDDIIRIAEGNGKVTMMIRLEGNGIGYSQLVLGHVNQLTEPWSFHWSNPGRWPWDWQVNMIHHDQVR